MTAAFAIAAWVAVLVVLAVAHDRVVKQRQRVDREAKHSTRSRRRQERNRPL